MEFRDVLSRRRMVRAYRDEPLPRETVERICRTIRRAPSGGFSQGARLLVVTDRDTRNQLGQLAGEDEYREPWISRAPVHIVVLTREEDYHERYRQPDKLRDGEEVSWPAPYWYVDPVRRSCCCSSPRSTRASSPGRTASLARTCSR